MIGQVLKNNNKCPECRMQHNCKYCDDWHYCDCGYWWKVRDGQIVAESHEGDVWRPKVRMDNVVIPRTATVVVAASNATVASRAQADFICDGVDDQVQIAAYTYQLDGFLPVEYEWTPNIMIEEIAKLLASD